MLHINPKTTDERLTYSMREVSRLLGLSETATFYAIRRGEIPSIRVGRRVLIPRAGLHGLLENPSDATQKQSNPGTEPL